MNDKQFDWMALIILAMICITVCFCVWRVFG